MIRTKTITTGAATRLFLVFLSALAFLSVFQGSAVAGDYTVQECNADLGDPLYTQTPDATWFNNSSYFMTRSCGDSSGIGVTTNPGSYGIPSYGAITFSAPAGTTFRNIVFSGLINSTGNHWGQITLYRSGGVLAYWSNGAGNGQVPVGVVRALSTVDHANGDALVTSLTCSPPCTGVPTNPALARIGHLTFAVSDDTPPSVSVGGDLVAGGVRHGTEHVAIGASDLGGGVRSAVVRVNGTQIAAPQNPSCVLPNGGVAGSFYPCSASAQLGMDLNTEDPAWRQGQNTLEVCAYDVATAPSVGNESPCVVRSILVDNSCEKSGGAPADQVSAGLKRNGALADATQVKSTESVPLEGSVTASGSPVQGANVCVFEQVDSPGDPRDLIAVAKSRSSGEFGVQLAPGPTRNVDVVYRFNNRTLDKSRLRIVSQVVPELEPKKSKLRNGKALMLSGSIPGPHNGDRQIAIQAKVGKRWRTFKNVKTDFKGQFKAKYRFKTTHGLIRYRFRALVKTQAGYPYLRGASAIRKVTVRG